MDSRPLESSDAKCAIFGHTQFDSIRLDSMACNFRAHSSVIEPSRAIKFVLIHNNAL